MSMFLGDLKEKKVNCSLLSNEILCLNPRTPTMAAKLTLCKCRSIFPAAYLVLILTLKQSPGMLFTHTEIYDGTQRARGTTVTQRKIEILYSCTLYTS